MERQLTLYQQAYRSSIQDIVDTANNERFQGQGLAAEELQQKIDQRIEQIVDCHMQSFKLLDPTLQQSGFAVIAVGGDYRRVRQAIDQHLLQASRNKNGVIMGKYQVSQLQQQKCLMNTL